MKTTKQILIPSQIPAKGVSRSAHSSCAHALTSVALIHMLAMAYSESLSIMGCTFILKLMYVYLRADFEVRGAWVPTNSIINSIKILAVQWSPPRVNPATTGGSMPSVSYDSLPISATVNTFASILKSGNISVCLSHKQIHSCRQM